MKSFTRESALRVAFENAKVDGSTSPQLVNKAMLAYEGRSGLVRNREWNAHLKHSTYRKLHTQNVI